MRYTGPKLKLCRREWVNLFGAEKYDLSKSKRTPLSRGFSRSSLFWQLLRKKQVAKRMFGVSEKQFVNYYKKAIRMSGNAGENMLQLLSTRLDYVIYQANFARTIMQARQFVNHAHFKINGVKVDICSYRVKVGDVIELRENKKDLIVYKGLKEEFEEFLKENKNTSITSAKWIKVDIKKMSIIVDKLPISEDFDQSINIAHIIEFYSK